MKKLFIVCALTLGMIISASPVINKHFHLSEEITDFLSTKKINDSNKFVLIKIFEELKENPDQIKKIKLDEDIEKIFKCNIIWALIGNLDYHRQPSAVAGEIVSTKSLDDIIKKLKKISKTGCDLIIPKKAIQEAANEFLKQLKALEIKTEKKQLSMNKTDVSYSGYFRDPRYPEYSCAICFCPINPSQCEYIGFNSKEKIRGPVHRACLRDYQKKNNRWWRKKKDSIEKSIQNFLKRIKNCQYLSKL